MTKISILKTSNIIAFILMVYVNYLSNTLPINGQTAGELSDKYVNYFVPAGITFTIWGVIYGWLLILIVYQLFSFFSNTIKEKMDPIIDKLGWLFVFSCILNVAWLLAWHYEQVELSVLIMASFLGTLIYIFNKINIGIKKINNLEKWISQAPFSIYLGWISVATIANFTALLVQINWNGFGISPSAWAKIMIIIAVLITSYMAIKKNAVFYAFTVVWALWGIHIKRSQIGNFESVSIDKFVYFGIGLILILVFIKTPKWLNY